LVRPVDQRRICNRPVGVAKARELLQRVIWVGDVDHITRLHHRQRKRAIAVGHLSSSEGRHDLVGRATRQKLAVVGVEANVEVAELKHIGLRCAELEL
jgi:hypothetical protein